MRAIAVLADIGDLAAAQTMVGRAAEELGSVNIMVSNVSTRLHTVTCKAGVFALSKAIAVEFGEFGITANTVAAGIIDTTRDLSQYPHFRNGYADRIQEIPVRRVGRVDDMAAACIYLAGRRFHYGTSAARQWRRCHVLRCIVDQMTVGGRPHWLRCKIE